MNMHWCSLKTDCTIKFIPKLYENTPLHSFNVTHVGTENRQVTITFMENQENTLINTEKMKVDEHALLLIKNRLHHKIFHTKIVGKHSSLMSLMLAQKIIK